MVRHARKLQKAADDGCQKWARSPAGMYLASEMELDFAMARCVDAGSHEHLSMDLNWYRLEYFFLNSQVPLPLQPGLEIA